MMPCSDYVQTNLIMTGQINHVLNFLPYVNDYGDLYRIGDNLYYKGS